MATIKDGYYPYKEFKYDEDQDAYELMSKWTSSDTVYMPNGSTNLTTKINALDELIGGIIDDTTTSETATWSSSKISNELTDLTTEVNKKAELYYQVLWPNGSTDPNKPYTATFDLFEGYFSLSRNTTVICGIIDRWGESVTYITPQDDTFATITFITESGKQKVVFQNQSSVSILLMFMADNKTN